MTTAPINPVSPPEDRSRVAPLWHTFIFIAGIIGLTLAQYHQNAQMATMHMRTRLPLYVAMIIFELMMLLYVWIGVFLAKKRLGDLIRGKWNTWIDFWRDIGIALAFTVVAWGVLAVVGFLLGTNNIGMKAVKMLIPRTPAEMVVWVVLSITAGFCEETIFRGYFQRQFLALTGSVEASVILQACVFGAAHLYQGWKGALTITIYGVLFGALAAWTKSLRPGMIQHAGQDTFSGIAGSLLLRYHKF